MSNSEEKNLSEEFSEQVYYPVSFEVKCLVLLSSAFLIRSVVSLFVFRMTDDVEDLLDAGKSFIPLVFSMGGLFLKTRMDERAFDRKLEKEEKILEKFYQGDELSSKELDLIWSKVVDEQGDNVTPDSLKRVVESGASRLVSPEHIPPAP